MNYYYFVFSNRNRRPLANYILKYEMELLAFTELPGCFHGLPWLPLPLASPIA